MLIHVPPQGCNHCSAFGEWVALQERGQQGQGLELSFPYTCRLGIVALPILLEFYQCKGATPSSIMIFERIFPKSLFDFFFFFSSGKISDEGVICSRRRKLASFMQFYVTWFERDIGQIIYFNNFIQII